MNMHEYKPHEQLGERVMLDKRMILANVNNYKILEEYVRYG